MSVYNINGNKIDTYNNAIFIASIKLAHPEYTDDQLLDEAISAAQDKDKSAVIVWDGADIHFSGDVSHICTGFGGIDFNNSSIYMPAYNNGTIIKIQPDDSVDIDIPATDLKKTYTDNTSIKDKVFSVNARKYQNAGMCLGSRIGFDDTIYLVQTIYTATDGNYLSGELFLLDNSQYVECKNVHAYPVNTFEVKNAVIVSYAGNTMSTLIECTRSNTHMHNFAFKGKSGITSFHSGPFLIHYCTNIELDHFYGENPVQEDNTSGYIVHFTSVTKAYVHDMDVGDANGWGVFGSAFLVNTVWERCYLNRWDCHYLQLGYNVIRECVMDHAQYGVGNGTIVFENCTFVGQDEATSYDYPMISIRDDCIGVFDGDISINNCDFLFGKQNTSHMIVLNEAITTKQPTNSAVPAPGKRSRIINGCRIPEGCKYVIKTGDSITSDQYLFDNITYAIKETTVSQNTTPLYSIGGTATATQETEYRYKVTHS